MPTQPDHEPPGEAAQTMNQEIADHLARVSGRLDRLNAAIQQNLEKAEQQTNASVEQLSMLVEAHLATVDRLMEQGDDERSP